MKKITLLLLFLLVNITLGFSQFVEEFEGGGLPPGWKIINVGDSGTWGSRCYSSPDPLGPAYSGRCYMRTIRDDSNDYLITRAITVVPGVNDQIYFFARSHTGYDTIDVLLSTTGTAAADFTVTLQAGVKPPYTQVKPPNYYKKSWYKYAYNLTAYTGQTVYIAFRTTALAYDFEIDDVVSQPIPSCNEPFVVTIADITNSQATINWPATIPAPANGYDYYVSQTDTAPTATTVPTGSTAAGVTTATITIPAGETSYVWARSKCSASDFSIWSDRVSFKSSCGPDIESYTENFDSTELPFIPDCTTVVNTGGYDTGGYWQTWYPAGGDYPNPNFTSKAARHLGYTASNSWLFTNGVTLTGGVSYTITYKYGNQPTDVGAPVPVDKMKVAYGTDRTVAAMTIPLADHPNITSITGATVDYGAVAFTPPASGTYYFGFNAYSDAESTILLDDIKITATALGTNSFNAVPFRAYPNPVKNILHFSSPEGISKVEIFNLLGQQMTAKELNVKQGQIDMSNLSTGTYMVKVTAANQVKTLKVIKE